MDGLADVGFQKLPVGRDVAAGRVPGRMWRAMRAGERAVEHGHAAAPYDFGQISKAKAAAGHDAKTAAGEFAKPADNGGAGEDVRPSARGKQVIGAGGHDVVKSGEKVRRFVESAMKSDFHGPGPFNELAGANDVYAAVRQQNTEGYSRGSGTRCSGDLGPHEGEFADRKHEIAVTRADEDRDRNGDRLERGGDEVGGRSNAAACQADAKFDLIGAASLGGAGGLESLRTKLKTQRIHK